MKKYLAGWGGSFGKPGLQVVEFDFFSDDNGYDEQDRIRISNLDVGWVWRANDWADHFVTVVPDDVNVLFLPKPPAGYTAEELENDNPYNQWMKE